MFTKSSKTLQKKVEQVYKKKKFNAKLFAPKIQSCYVKKNFTAKCFYIFILVWDIIIIF